MTFTASNWDTSQTVTVTGVDDPAVDGSQATTITVSVDDGNSDDAFDPVAGPDSVGDDHRQRLSRDFRSLNRLAARAWSNRVPRTRLR